MLKNRISVLIALFLVSPMVFANTDCSIDSIEKLSPGQQLEAFSTCSKLMEKRLQLLKTKKQIEELGSAPKLNSSLPAPGALSGKQNTIPSYVAWIETINGKSTAKLGWPNGRTMRVKEGTSISENVKVNHITEQGVEISKSGQTFFIGKGENNSVSNNLSGMPSQIPMY